MTITQLQPLKSYERLLALFISFLMVAFGQPAGIPWLSILAAILGYGIMCRVLLDLPNQKSRFWLGTFWFTAVQTVQLSWLLTHPYHYIYFVHASFSFLCGFQWGIFSLFVTYKNMESLFKLIGMASLWTLLEWSRLFFLSGYTWNPAGMALTDNLYSLQFTSIGGVFALSFWVIFVNLLALRAWLCLPKKKPAFLWICCALLPYVFGIAHLYVHQERFNNDTAPSFRTLLVQTAFPAEEALAFENKASYIAFILEEWKQIFKILSPHFGKEVDLIALPEYVVPLGTYTYVFPYSTVKKAFTTVFGASAKEALPVLEAPLARTYVTPQGDVWFVNNAFIVQSIANLFQTQVIAGLEDADENEQGQRHYYSAAIQFKPNATAEHFPPRRYSKRILLPMAEYIPFSGFHALAALYGVQGSFTCGKEATVFEGNPVPFGTSICYEETFGNLMRECKHNGAELFVNLTSDVWYPNSSLPKQHFDHGRLRSVENGLPIVRACNTGITSAIDSLGRIVAMLGDGSPASQWIPEALYAEVPRYHYRTIYSYFGDSLILAMSSLGVVFLFFRPKDS